MRPPSPPVRKNGAEAVVAEGSDAAVGAKAVVAEDNDTAVVVARTDQPKREVHMSWKLTCLRVYAFPSKLGNHGFHESSTFDNTNDTMVKVNPPISVRWQPILALPCTTLDADLASFGVWRG